VYWKGEIINEKKNIEQKSYLSWTTEFISLKKNTHIYCNLFHDSHVHVHSNNVLEINEHLIAQNVLNAKYLK
jgi:hypothetical protein